MDIPKRYQELLSKFPIGSLGKGVEPRFQGEFFQPMTYGALLIAESNAFKKYGRNETCERLEELTFWLLDHADLDNDKLFGWGLPFAWDAFNDGSENPIHHPYTITTAIVLEGFLELLSIPHFLPHKTKKRIQTLVKDVCLTWCHHVWSDRSDGGFFWYSPSHYDAIFTPNVSLMFTASLIRFYTEHHSFLSKSEQNLFESRIHRSIKSILSTVTKETGYPLWHYKITSDKNYDRLNDLVHHGYILFGLERYRSSFQGNLPWKREVGLDSLRLYIHQNQLYEFPQSDKIQTFKHPSRLWGVGMMLALFGLYGEEKDVSTIFQILLRDYGSFPNVTLYPLTYKNDTTFYARHASHLLWGLSYQL